jgi:phosphoribosylformylglycinamidine cyclo-ligase
MRAFYESHGARFEDVEGVFNMGAGMIAVVAADAEAKFHQICKDLGLGSTTIGQMIPGSGESTVRYI